MNEVLATAAANIGNTWASTPAGPLELVFDFSAVPTF